MEHHGPGFDQRLDVLTLRVEDLDAATRFYADGLGWQPLLAVPGEVTFFQVGHGRVLSLFGAEGFDAEADGQLASPFTLAQNVQSEDEVQDAVDRLVEAGATVVKAPTKASWGGAHALVRDPAGFGWEIAHNPGMEVADDGTVTMRPVED